MNTYKQVAEELLHWATRYAGEDADNRIPAGLMAAIHGAGTLLELDQAEQKHNAEQGDDDAMDRKITLDLDELLKLQTAVHVAAEELDAFVLRAVEAWHEQNSAEQIRIEQEVLQEPLEPGVWPDPKAFPDGVGFDTEAILRVSAELEAERLEAAADDAARDFVSFVLLRYEARRKQQVMGKKHKGTHDG